MLNEKISTYFSIYFDQPDKEVALNFSTLEYAVVRDQNVAIEIAKGWHEHFSKQTKGQDGSVVSAIVVRDQASNIYLITDSFGGDGYLVRQTKEGVRHSLNKSDESNVEFYQFSAKEAGTLILMMGDTSVVTFDLDNIQNGFSVQLVNVDKDQYPDKENFLKKLNEVLSAHIFSFNEGGKLHYKFRINPLLLLRSSHYEEQDLDKLNLALMASLPEDSRFFYPGDYYAHKKKLAGTVQKFERARYIDLLPSTDHCANRLEGIQSIIVVLNEEACWSLTRALDLWIPIMQWAQAVGIEVKYQQLDTAFSSGFYRALKQCFGGNDDKLTLFYENPVHRNTDVYVLPPHFKLSDVHSSKKFIIPKRDNSSVQYLINLAVALGVEDDLLAEGLMSDKNMTKLIIQRYGLAKWYRTHPLYADIESIKNVLPYVEALQEDENAGYLDLMQKAKDAGALRIEDAGLSDVLEIYEAICKSTVSAIKNYNPTLPEVSRESKGVFGEVASTIRVPIEDIRKAQERKCCDVPNYLWLWGFMVLAAGVITMVLVRILAGEWIENEVKEIFDTDNPWVIKPIALAAEAVSAVAGGAVIPIVKKAGDGLCFCTHRFFSSNSSRGDEENQIPLETQPLLPSRKL